MNKYRQPTLVKQSSEQRRETQGIFSAIQDVSRDESIPRPHAKLHTNCLLHCLLYYPPLGSPHKAVFQLLLFLVLMGTFAQFCLFLSVDTALKGEIQRERFVQYEIWMWSMYSFASLSPGKAWRMRRYWLSKRFGSSGVHATRVCLILLPAAAGCGLPNIGPQSISGLAEPTT